MAIMATHIGQRLQNIARLNPWWRDDSGWADFDIDLQSVKDSGLDYQPVALLDLQPGCLYTLRGPRRVGKTVTVKQCIRQLLESGVTPTNIIRLAVDDWNAKELRTAVENITLPRLPEGEQRYWFIDEITSVVGNWDQQIKWLRDNDPEFARATVVLTGSNARSLTDATGVLAGRRGRGVNLDRTLFPMGFKTFVQSLAWEKVPNVSVLDLGLLRSEDARDSYYDLLPWIDILAAQWELYLMYGGYPRMVACVNKGLPVDVAFVNDAFDVVYGDVFRHSRFSQAEETQLLERLWSAMAMPVSLRAIALEMDVSKDTIKRHVDYLRDSYLLWSCPQKDESRWRARKGAIDKLYTVDPLIARLAYLRSETRNDIDITVLSEMQMGNALRKRIWATHPAAENDDFLFYHRTPTGKEIDFVSKYLGEVALESKYTESGRWNSESQTLNASTWKGVVATKNVLDTNATDDKAWAVPAGILAYLIDI